MALLGCASPSTGVDARAADSRVTTATEPSDESKLAALWQERLTDGANAVFSIGPGDVLEVSVEGLPELERTSVRVSADERISLPLIGTLPVAGLNEASLAELIRERLDGNVMYDPSVRVFMLESRHRNVGVIGEVYKPGFYPTASAQDTVLDLISLAGGMNENAASRALLHPASADNAATLPGAPSAERRGNAIVIEFGVSGQSRYLGLPVRPGDVIVVPERGNVLVKGWVAEPGSFPITSGLTVLGAVAAAGGARFGADQGAVSLIRGSTGPNPERIPFDLAKLQSGEQQDQPVQAGDVIDVAASPPKAAASGIFDFLGRILSVGTRATF